VSCFRFISAEKATFPIAFMCRHLGVSRSGYHAWARRPPSARTVADQVLSERIRAIHEASRCTYGAPRIHAELGYEGHRVSRKRVARLMRQARVQGVYVRRRYRTTRRRLGAAPAPDLVERRFRSARPDRLWVADITYCSTSEGFVHLAAVMDCYSRRIVGWAMAPHLRTELVADALEMAIARRRPDPGLVHHSDQGSQYVSLAFGRRLREAEILPSMGTVGDAYDNAAVESFFGTLKRELINRHRWPTRAAVRTAVFDYIEVFYNRRRLHSHNGQLSPEVFERRYPAEASAS
jgi:putative transposase